MDDDRGSGDQADRGRCPVDLQLEWVLGKMPQKEFEMERLAPTHQPLALPARLKVKDALDRVLRLPAVASKRYLTNKVCFSSPSSTVSVLVSLSTFVQTLCDSLRLHSVPLSGGPVCDWVGCPATVRRPPSHPIGRRGCCCSVTVQPGGSSYCHRRAANQRPGLSCSRGSHGCWRGSDQFGVCQSHSFEGEWMMESVRKITNIPKYCT